MATLITLPAEVLQRIIHYSTPRDLLQICRVRSFLHNVIVLRIYHSIQFLDPTVEVSREYKYFVDNNFSTAIKKVKSLVRSHENSINLYMLITVVVLLWAHELDGTVKSDILSIPRLVGRGLTRFHYALPEWDLIIQRLYPVTLIYMPCPSKTLLTKQIINPVFSVPTITYVTLYQCESLSLLS